MSLLRSIRFRIFLVIAVTVFVSSGIAHAVELQKITPDQGSRNDSPVLTFDAQGRLWVAWSSFQNGKYRLAVASRAPDGTTSPIRYPDSSKTDQVDPVLVLSPEGTPCVIYSAHDGKTWTVRKVSCTGQDGPEILGHGVHPTAVVAGKHLWIAWQQDPQLVVLSPSGQWPIRPAGMAQANGMNRLNSPVLAAGPNGEVWLAWDAVRPGYRSIRLKRIDEPGHSEVVVDNGIGISRHPSLSVDSDGHVWIVNECLLTTEQFKKSSEAGSKGPGYDLDHHYHVTKPAHVVLVTDGKQFWTPYTSKTAAFGLAPSIYCSSKGPVWLLSRFYQRFAPLCESLGAGGWHNYRKAWTQKPSYKKQLPFAESPDGQVWTAWVEQHRERTGFKKAPTWSVLDGPDTIMLAPMPKCQTPGKPRLVSITKPMTVAGPEITHPNYSTNYKGERLNVYFGDIHVHSEFSGCGRTNGSIEEDIAYSRDVRDLDFYAPGDHAEHLNDHNWHETLMAMRKHDQPGKFVPYMAFEWTSEFDRGGSLYRGHYNPLFRQLDKGERYFSASDTRTNTPLELWNALRNTVGGPENVITIPHHPSRRNAWVSWCYHDPEMAPLIEIAQVRGSYEYQGCPRGLDLNGDTTRVTGHFIQDGLNRGMHFGIVSNSDHAGRNLTAVFSPKLERDALFQNLRAKRAYGTNGSRIFLDTRINGHFMGEQFRLKSDQPRMIEIHAEGTAPFVQIDLFRNGHIIRHWKGNRKLFRTKCVDTDPLFARENYYYVRVMQLDGGMAWSSPIWVVNKDVPGQFRFQVGGDELHVVYPGQESDISILMHNEKDQPVNVAVTLDVPKGWKINESMPIMVECPPGGWKHAVFNVTPPDSAFSKLSLPRVIAKCRYDGDLSKESKLFVVGSPNRISNENKAKLIDARAWYTPEQFKKFVEMTGPKMIDEK